MDMGKRPSRQRRHLPTSVTSAVTSRSTTDDRKHVPLLKMAFREKNVKKDDFDMEDSEAEEELGSSSSYNYTPNTSMNNRRSRKRTTTAKNNNNNNNNNEMKKRTQRFVYDQKLSKSNKRKKQMIWLVSTLWIMFVVYRIFISLKKEDYGNLSIFHFISNVVLKKKH